MKDFELYQQILGLVEPWRVESVTLQQPYKKKAAPEWSGFGKQVDSFKTYF
jgi:hypothetical protein